jgi:hypothetical protein
VVVIAVVVVQVGDPAFVAGADTEVVPDAVDFEVAVPRLMPAVS